MRSVTCHIVILGLVDGRSDTQYTVSRNSHTIYACVAVQCPYGSTGTTIRKKLDSFFIKGGTVVSGKFGTAGTLALLQNIQIRGLRFDILGKGVPQITAYDTVASCYGSPNRSATAFWCISSPTPVWPAAEI